MASNYSEKQSSNYEGEIHAEVSTDSHGSALHIPKVQGETVFGSITNVTLTLIIFSVIVVAMSLLAKKVLTSAKKSKFRLGCLTFVKFFDDQLRDAFGNKETARKYYGLVVGMFVIILFGNLFGLIIDWIGMSIAPGVLYYLRPIHSDINTTLVLSSVVVFMMLVIQITSNGALKTIKSYAFNFHGDSIVEKCIGVFLGWLHFIGLGSTLISLALRLFGNIFAGIVLIGVISFLLAGATDKLFEVGRIAVLPFWFFEVFVALIQAIVFTYLMIAYFKQSAEHH